MKINRMRDGGKEAGREGQVSEGTELRDGLREVGKEGGGGQEGRERRRNEEAFLDRW